VIYFYNKISILGRIEKIKDFYEDSDNKVRSGNKVSSKIVFILDSIGISFFGIQMNTDYQDS